MDTTPNVIKKQGWCNCCGKDVVLLHDTELGESICHLCRSYDVMVKPEHLRGPLKVKA